jgi:hypothetical protein
MFCFLSLIIMTASQNIVFGQKAIGDSFPFQLSIKDFTLNYEHGPTLGKYIVGKPLVASTIVQNDLDNSQTNASYMIQVIDKNRVAISIQTKSVEISSRAPIEIVASWIPEVPGTYTITGFIWLQSNNRTNIALAAKTSVSVDVRPEIEVKTYTVCSTGCDFSDLQKAIDRLHKPENKILVKEGEYQVVRAINVWSHTNLEFAAGAKITYLGAENKSIFRGNKATNIEIVNPQIIVSGSNTGIKAFSFTSSSRINITGAEVSLNKGGGSVGFYCRDCTDVAISGMNMSEASRLIDIGTSSQINNGKSSNIWILDGKFGSSSIEGIKVNFSERVYIIRNNISNTNDNAVDIGYSAFCIVRDNRIENGGVPGGSGVHTDSASSAEIFGNFVNGTGEAAITVYRATGINIMNNTIMNPGSVGIAIITTEEPSSSIRAKHNIIGKSQDSAIFVSPNQRDVVLSDNEFAKLDQNK